MLYVCWMQNQGAKKQPKKNSFGFFFPLFLLLNSDFYSFLIVLLPFIFCNFQIILFLNWPFWKFVLSNDELPSFTYWLSMSGWLFIARRLNQRFFIHMEMVMENLKWLQFNIDTYVDKFRTFANSLFLI